MFKSTQDALVFHKIGAVPHWQLQTTACATVTLCILLHGFLLSSAHALEFVSSICMIKISRYQPWHKYYETEKQSNNDLDIAKNNLKEEQEKVDFLLSNFSSESLKKNIHTINEIRSNIDKIIQLVNSNNSSDALIILDTCKTTLNYLVQTINENEDHKKISDIGSKNETIKNLQEVYADNYSKNQNLKKESIKRNERIKTIDKEINSWKNLLSNSEKMVNELNDRKQKLDTKLNELEKQPQSQAEKKGQISENLRISDKEKIDNDAVIKETDQNIETLRTQLNEIQEQSIQIRERKASSGATIEGLKKRKNDLVDRIYSELNLKEDNILENSNLFGKEELPDAVNQEDLLDKKKVSPKDVSFFETIEKISIPKFPNLARNSTIWIVLLPIPSICVVQVHTP